MKPTLRHSFDAGEEDVSGDERERKNIFRNVALLLFENQLELLISNLISSTQKLSERLNE